MYRGRPPSAGACHTTDALLKPDCGRARNWSSTITAITGRRARAALIGSPVRGAGTTAGLGDAEGDALALGDALAVDDGLGCDGGVVGLGEGVGVGVALGVALGDVAALADGLAPEAAGAAVVPNANTASAPTATMPA